MNKVNFDEMSLKILALLQENARLSYTEIGKKVGLTTPSVIERIKKLEDSGVIENYTVNINAEKLGYTITAVMLVSFTGTFKQQEKNIIESLSKYYQVAECLRITGKNDFLIKIHVRSMDEFKIINDEVAQYGQVDTSLVVTTFEKNTSINLKKMLGQLKQ